MAKNTSYNGTIDLISGIRPKNNGTFPLMDAHDVQTQEDGTRLDAELLAMRALGLTVVNGQVCQIIKEA